MRLKEKRLREALRQLSTKGFLTTAVVEIVQAAGTLKPGAAIDKIVEMIFPGPMGDYAIYTSDKPVQNLLLTTSTLVTCLDSICENSKTEQPDTTR